MRDNNNLKITTSRVVLVPYLACHVPLYHQWMKDPFLQEATASEPLTLEQEYEMQQSWFVDPDKCTFIVLDPSQPDTPGTGELGGAMVGDVNLFLLEPGEAEVEVMIAESSARGKGIGRQAVQLMMSYGATRLAIHKFVVKIGDSNEPSLALFHSLGFVEESRSQVFQEVTLVLPVFEQADGDGDGSAARAYSAAMSRILDACRDAQYSTL